MMKVRLKLSVLLVWAAIGAMLFHIFGDDPKFNNRLAKKVIVGEAADQGFLGMLGVAEVIRERGKIKGFSVTKIDLDAFVKRQPPAVRWEAWCAWKLSKYTNLTRNSDHFENVKAFGPPPWEKAMNKTIRIKDIQYYKAK